MDANLGIGHQAVPAAPETQRLRSNVLSLWPVVAMGLAYMSLAPVIYFNAGAVRGMIAHLGRTHELQPLDAFSG